MDKLIAKGAKLTEIPHGARKYHVFPEYTCGSLFERRAEQPKERVRIAPVPVEVGVVLALYRLVWTKATAAVTDPVTSGEIWEEWGFVFTSRHGTPVDPRNFKPRVHDAVPRAGAPVITVHDARRTCATSLVDLDVHPRVVMQVLRHAKFSITMEIYSKVTSAQTRDALKRLGDSLDEQLLLYLAAMRKEIGPADLVDRASDLGGPKWTWTTDLFLIREAL
jgi:integrase